MVRAAREQRVPSLRSTHLAVEAVNRQRLDVTGGCTAVYQLSVLPVVVDDGSVARADQPHTAGPDGARLDPSAGLADRPHLGDRVSRHGARVEHDVVGRGRGLVGPGKGAAHQREPVDGRGHRRQVHQLISDDLPVRPLDDAVHAPVGPVGAAHDDGRSVRRRVHPTVHLRQQRAPFARIGQGPGEHGTRLVAVGGQYDVVTDYREVGLPLGALVRDGDRRSVPGRRGAAAAHRLPGTTSRRSSR